MYEHYREFAQAVGQLAAFFAGTIIVLAVFLIQWKRIRPGRIRRFPKLMVGAGAATLGTLVLIVASFSSTVRILEFAEGGPLNLDAVNLLISLYYATFVGGFGLGLGGLYLMLEKE